MIGRDKDITKVADARRSGFRYSTRMLQVGSIFVLLVLAVVVELMCLGILYLHGGKDKRAFAQNHLLTGLFVPAPNGPVPGKTFLGHLRDDNRWDEFLIPDGLLGWRLGPNISVYYSPSRYADEYLYLTDGNAFSADVDDPPVTRQKPADVYRVVVLGGSTVMGDGSPRPSQNLVGALRTAVRDQKIAAVDGKHVEFINAGIDGYNSAQEYLYFLSDLVRFEPDLVVVYDGWNDSYIWNDPFIMQNGSPFRTESHQEGTRRIKESFSVSGAALLALDNLKFSLTEGNSRLGMIELPWRVFHNPASHDGGVRSPAASFDPRLVEYYRENRRAFLALADDRLAVALFLQPLVGTDDRASSDEEKASWWYPELAWEIGNRVPFYQGARRVLAELKEKVRDKRQACIADLSDSLKGVTEPVYADTGHLLPMGNRIVAARMLEQLASCGLIAKGVP